MAKIVVVTSGKGGVGKTTTSASFAAGLALPGHKTAVIDFDVGLRNLDLIMGCERRVVYDLINVIQGEANLNQALIKDKQCDNLFVLAASQTRDKDALTQDGVEQVLNDLADMGFDYIVCDSPAGIETGALMAMHFADEALVVTNPEVSSVRDSDRILGMLAQQDQARDRGQGAGQGAPADHALQPEPRGGQGRCCRWTTSRRSCASPLIGVIPESEIGAATPRNQGMPAVHLKGTDVSEAYKDVVARFLGEERPMRFVDAAEARASSSACSAGGERMSILSFLLGEKKKTASVAKERLQIILAHERSGRGGAARLPAGAAARAGGGDLQVRITIKPDDIKVQPGAPGQPRSAAR